MSISNFPDTSLWYNNNNNLQSPSNQNTIMNSPNNDFNLKDEIIHQNSISQHLAMFEKPLTPSDVGKLNRLVIPKQHAEKYFPLAVDSGLLLSFEDELGKCWRFRYSYWNSSQSYVLTKGWSRYVKDKRLDAGDVVLFARDKDDCDRFFIGWRRRCDGGGDGGWLSNNGLCAYPTIGEINQGHGAVPNQSNTCTLHAGGVVQNQTKTSCGGSSKTVRLFGVNLDVSSETEVRSTPDSVSLSSQYQDHHHHYLFYSDQNTTTNRH